MINENKNNHKLVGMLQYNFNLTNDDVELFIEKPTNFNFLKKHKNTNIIGIKLYHFLNL